MTDEALAAALIVAQQEHRPPAGAHFVLLAGAVVAALVLFGMRWWRGRRDTADTEGHSGTGDRPADSTRSTEDE